LLKVFSISTFAAVENPFAYSLTPGLPLFPTHALAHTGPPEENNQLTDSSTMIPLK
jgi:hypothetical protein